MIEDHGDIELETTEGWRPAPSRGERVLVILAAVALLGGALIVGGNLLQNDDVVGLASGSPGPSASPRPTPYPTPPPIELTVGDAIPMPSPAESATPIPFSGWIRAKADLPILDAPVTTASEVGTLRAGGAAYADEVTYVGEEAGWVSINVSEETGYLATRADGEELVRRYPPVEWPVVGSLSSLAAGPSGFVAIGNRAGRSGSYPLMTVFASADGAAWHVASEPPSSGQLTGAAWGPAGWLLVAADERGEMLRLWSSPDAEHWSTLGSLPLGYPQGLQAFSRGYLLETSEGRGGQLAWFSTDGIHWTESRPGLGDNYYRVTATTAGFYATTTQGCCPGPARRPAAFSTDGLTWSPAPPHLLVGSVDDGLVGIAAGLDGRGGYPQRGTFYQGHLGWRTLTDGELAFSGAVVTSLVSDGEHATAFGWDVATDAPLAWTSDGGPWTRQRLPAAFGVPSFSWGAAALNGHVVAVGASWNARGPNPVVWHRGEVGFWEPERSPVAGVVPEPTAADCGALPTDAVVIQNMDRTLAVACHGDAPMTIRFWSSRCDRCMGESQGSFDEKWLSQPIDNILYLSPMDGPEGWWWSSAVLAPTLASAPDPAWVDAWLEVTGHFDDPAATSCHWTPPPDELPYYGGARSIIEGCRQQFVVTAVQVVDGP